MSLEELKRYKNMPIENIDRKIVPDIEDIKGKKNIVPLSMYFMKVGNVVVKCSYAGNGRHLEDCLLSYLKKKAMLLDQKYDKGADFFVWMCYNISQIEIQVYRC